jgi:hypothetical protein
VSAKHSEEAASQAARETLASLNAGQRAFLEAPHAEYFPSRADRGPACRLEDLLCHLAGGDRHGAGDRWLARALAVPVEYLAVVREAAGLPRAAQKRSET